MKNVIIAIAFFASLAACQKETCQGQFLEVVNTTDGNINYWLPENGAILLAPGETYTIKLDDEIGTSVATYQAEGSTEIQKAAFRAVPCGTVTVPLN